MDGDKQGGDSLHLRNYSSSMDHSQKQMVGSRESGGGALADVREEDERLEVSPSKAARGGADGQPRTLSADALRKQFDESDDDEPGTLGFAFDPYGANRGTARYRQQMEARNQLSGCVFGILGLAILGLSSWLLHRGSNSHRQEEITTYLEDVRKWKHFYQKEFEQLELGVSFLNGSFTPLTKTVGEKTAELDMKIALGRASTDEYHKLRKHSHDMTEMDFAASSKRRLSELKLAPIDYNSIPNEKLDIEYTPIKYEITVTPNETNLLFEREHLLDTTRVHQPLAFTLNYTGNDANYINSQEKILSDKIPLLYKTKHFSKQQHYCQSKKGLSVSGRQCLIFFKLSKVCVLIDQDITLPETVQQKQGNQTISKAVNKKAWSIQGTCGYKYAQQIKDSREPVQDIDFIDYPITVEVRSVHDPHYKFGMSTGGKFILDVSSHQMKAAGSVLIFFAICMLCMAGYKSYRFCIKYTCREWIEDQRRRRYLAEQHSEDDDSEVRERAKKSRERIRRIDLEGY